MKSDFQNPDEGAAQGICAPVHGDRPGLKSSLRAAGRCLAAMACLVAALQAPGAEPGQAPAQKQQKLIGVLQSQAAPGEKGLACKGLASCGTAEAVPALARLLSDPDLASWARIALEAIPGPEADNALVQAVPELHGRLLVGTLNSIGFRRSTEAVSVLVSKLGDTDADVASAAAVALGRIGGLAAANSLEQTLPKAPEAVRGSVAEGCILCAERFLSAGDADVAIRLYDLVREAQVPKQRELEALRGAILARKSAGLPLLRKLLHSSDKAYFDLALSTARELAGVEVGRALAEEMSMTSPDRQGYVLLALADRGESEAMPTVLDAAKKGPKNFRLTAIGILDQYGNASAAPTLLEAAAEGDPEIESAALAALARLPGSEVDADLVARLPQAGGKSRQTLIKLAALRQVEAALPAVSRCAQDPDPATRSAALRALGTLGDQTQIPELARLLGQTQDAKERAEIEAALLGISGRKGTLCVPHLLPMAQDPNGAIRLVALHALASAGGPQALAAVRAELQDKEQPLQDEAVRTLSTWPNTWPEDDSVAAPLLALAQSDENPSHQVLALRGYLQFLQGDKKLNAEQKSARLKEALPLLKRPEEKRLAIAVLQSTTHAQALEMLAAFAAEPAIADEACSALLNLAARNRSGATKEQRQKALQAVVAHAPDEATRKKAQQALEGLR